MHERQEFDSSIFRLRASPVVNDDPLEMAIKGLVKNKKIVMWEKPKGYGWGNRIATMIKTVIFAIAFDMKIIMDHDQYEASFNDPVAGEWFKGYNGHRSGINFDSKTWNLNTPVTHMTSNDWGNIPQEWIDKLVAKGLFTKDNDVAHIWMTIGRFLTRSPSPQLLEKVNNLKQKMGGVLTFDTTVQVRTMKDFAPGHKIAMSAWKQKEIWECVDKVVNARDEVYFTTDEILMYDIAKKQLNKSHVNTVPHDLQHSSHTTELIPSGIVEWYLIGESDTVVCSMTSFCSTAVARRYGSFKNVYAISNTYKKDKVKCMKRY